MKNSTNGGKCNRPRPNVGRGDYICSDPQRNKWQIQCNIAAKADPQWFFNQCASNAELHQRRTILYFQLSDHGYRVSSGMEFERMAIKLQHISP